MIQIKLDPLYFKNIDDFDKRFSNGVPSLVACESLTVKGDVFFGPRVTIKGAVTITGSRKTAAVVPEGAIIEKDLVL